MSIFGRSVFAVLILAALIVPDGVSSAQVEPVREVSAVVSFSAPISIEEAVNWAAQYDIHVTQILHTYEVTGRVFSGGFLVDADMSQQQVLSDYRSTLQGIYQDLSNATTENLKDSAHLDESIKADLMARQIALAELSSDLTDGNTAVMAIDILTRPDELTKIAALPLVGSVELSEPSPTSVQSAEVSNAPDTVLAGNWWPNSGYVRSCLKRSRSPGSSVE